MRTTLRGCFWSACFFLGFSRCFSCSSYVQLLKLRKRVGLLSVRADSFHDKKTTALLSAPYRTLIFHYVLLSPAAHRHPPLPHGVSLCILDQPLRVRSALQVQLGVLDFKEQRCIQSEDVYGAVVCPEGFFKVALGVFDSKCSDLGSECGIYLYCLSMTPPRLLAALLFSVAKAQGARTLFQVEGTPTSTS